MADSTLSAIRTKIRRLTKSPSTAQITDAQLNEYINTFVLYDFPEHLRTFILRQTLTFYTAPNQPYYETSTTISDPLFNFKNRVIAVHKPAYIAGYQVMFSQSREEFYNVYPIVNSIQNTGQAGDGVTTNFTGTLSQIPILQERVTFTFDSQDPLNAVYARDNGIGGLIDQDGTVAGTINYVTGAYDVTFSVAPAQGIPITIQAVPYTAALPQGMLFFEDRFELRPVPDGTYPVQIEVDIRPTELLENADEPNLEQWWQYIAFSASKKIFEDRMDMESVQLIMPALKEQERLVNRTTIVNQTKERAATIYTQQTNFSGGSGYFGGGFGGGF